MTGEIVRQRGQRVTQHLNLAKDTVRPNLETPWLASVFPHRGPYHCPWVEIDSRVSLGRQPCQSWVRRYERFPDSMQDPRYSPPACGSVNLADKPAGCVIGCVGQLCKGSARVPAVRAGSGPEEMGNMYYSAAPSWTPLECCCQNSMTNALGYI